MNFINLQTIIEGLNSQYGRQALPYFQHFYTKLKEHFIANELDITASYGGDKKQFIIVNFVGRVAIDNRLINYFKKNNTLPVVAIHICYNVLQDTIIYNGWRFYKLNFAKMAQEYQYHNYRGNVPFNNKFNDVKIYQSEMNWESLLNDIAVVHNKIQESFDELMELFFSPDAIKFNDEIEAMVAEERELYDKWGEKRKQIVGMHAKAEHIFMKKLNMLGDFENEKSK